MECEIFVSLPSVVLPDANAVRCRHPSHKHQCRAPSTDLACSLADMEEAFESFPID